MSKSKLVSNFSSLNDIYSITSANDIISLWIKQRTEIYKQLNEGNILDPLNILFKDVYCRSCGGWGERPFNLRQVCSGCLLLTRLCPTGSVPETGQIPVLTGAYEGVTLNVRISDKEMSSFSEHPELTLLAQSVMNRMLKLVVCENDYIKQGIVKFLGSESQADIYALISSFLYHEMRIRKIPCTPTYVTSYGCGSKTFIVDICPRMGTGTLSGLAEDGVISTKTTIGILHQLLTVLHLVTNFGFVHGDACIHNLAFGHEPVEFTYKGVTITSPRKLVFIPSIHSSLTVPLKDEVVRYFHSVVSYVSGPVDSLPVDEFVPFIGKAVCTGVCETEKYVPSLQEMLTHHVMGYRIGKRKATFRHYTRNEGIPLMFSSYDFYSFLVSLMSNSLFFKTATTIEDFMLFWAGLWHPSEYEGMMIELEEHMTSGKTLNSSQVLDFLSKRVLRCDTKTYIAEYMGFTD